MYRSFFIFVLFFSFHSVCWGKNLHPAPGHRDAATVKSAKNFDEYVRYFHQVFEIVDANYYVKPDPAQLDSFITKFKSKIYPALASEGKSDDYVKWRATWYLVDSLKTSQDKFSQFYPPKPAEKFQREALGQRIDLGLEGNKNEQGFYITHVEPRADAYAKGLREGDVITSIDGQSLLAKDQKTIEGLLNPLINATVKIGYTGGSDAVPREVNVTSREYFKQTVFLRPVAVPGVFCLEIPKFNRTSGEDLYRFLAFIQRYNPQGLVIDLRGNPGGPPLAAREMAAFFLKGGEEFAYFQRRGQPKSDLDVPVIDEALKYNGPLVILVNEESGSAAELFTGIMQFRKRALVLGETTAGQVLLKSMFDINDGAMVALVTGLGYYPDGHTFGFNGIVPDKKVEGAPKEGLVNLAAAMIMYSQHQIH